MKKVVVICVFVFSSFGCSASRYYYFENANLNGISVQNIDADESALCTSVDYSRHIYREKGSESVYENTTCLLRAGGRLIVKTSTIFGQTNIYEVMYRNESVLEGIIDFKNMPDDPIFKKMTEDTIDLGRRFFKQAVYRLDERPLKE